jgi:predicted phage replisome organizer
MEIKWIKVSTDLFANRKIRLIESMEDRDSIIVIWLKLMILAGEINDGGLIYLTQNIPYTAESLAIQFNRKTEEVQKALSVFEEYGMILIDSDGVIEIANWDVYQNVDRMEEIREYNRLAQQRSREKKKASAVVNDNVNDKSMTESMKCQHRIDKNRKEKNRLDKNREDSKEREIADADPQDLLRMISKKMNKNALYGTDKEVNS